MPRCILALVALLVASTTLGCAMCAAPFDYTGPVPADGFSFVDRAGSILAGTGMSGSTFDGEVSEEAVGPTAAEEVPVEMQGEPVMGQPTYAPQPSYGPSSRQMQRQYWR